MIGKPMKRLLVSLCILFFGCAIAAASDGMYDLDATGWLRKPAQDGEVLACAVCEKTVQVQISVGPEMDKNSPVFTNAQFATKFSKESDQRVFADMIIRDSALLKANFQLTINRIGVVPLGGLQVLQFAALVEMGRSVIRDTTIVTVHKGRIIKITANYYDGDLTPKASEALRTLLSSVRFVQ